MLRFTYTTAYIWVQWLLVTTTELKAA